MLIRLHLVRLFVASLLLAAAPARAQDGTAEATFDITVRGFLVAVVGMTGIEQNGAYSTRGRMETRGIAGVLRKAYYHGYARGRRQGARYVPEFYEERADTGRRKSEAVIEYTRGVPSLKKYSPPRPVKPQDVDPATQGGTLDPMTAIYVLLRDRPVEELCTDRIKTFDGKRLAEVVLGGLRREGEMWRCDGVYRRLRGFTEKEMSRKVEFPFTSLWRVSDGVARVEIVETDTLYGRARLERR